MNINRIGVNPFQTSYSIKTKNENFSAQNANAVASPSFIDVKSFADVGFRGVLDTTRIYLLYPDGLRYYDGRKSMPNLKNYQE